jgi:hypothetical protein
VHLGQVGQPSPDPVNLTKPPDTTMAAWAMASAMKVFWALGWAGLDTGQEYWLSRSICSSQAITSH